MKVTDKLTITNEDNALYKVRFNMESKTKTCYWCKKRKKTEETYYLEKKGKRQIRICVDCNLEHEIV